MPGIVTRRFRIHNAEQFFEAFDEASSTLMYIFIGRVHAWPNGDTTPNPEDSIYDTRYEPWRDMIAMKRVTSSDVRFSVPRKNWTTGTVYDEYDDKSSTYYDGDFYVVTDDFNVYKVMFNNYGAQSTVQPTGTGTSLISTSDGYIWKFLYSISSAETLKFVTNNFIPVKTLSADDGSAQFAVQQAAANGAIEITRLTANGSGYTFRANTFASVTSSTIQVLDAGASGTDDFFNGASLFISSGLGSGQVRTISDYNGTTKAVTVSPGFSVTPNTSSRFHIGPDIGFTGDGSNASAYANGSVVNGTGNLTKINMVNVGSGYSRAEVTITDADGSSGTGAAATPRLSPPGGHGSDPVGELAGHNVMLNVRINASEGNTFPTNNDFRIVGLVRDPLLANGAVANATSYDVTSKLNVTGITSGPFQLDEIVDGASSGAKARIVSFANTNASGTNGTFRVVNLEGTFTSETITGNTSSATATLASTSGGSIQLFSGDVIYNEYRSVISRASDQIEDVKLVVQY